MFRRTVVQLTFLCAAVAGAQVLPPDAGPPSGDFAPAQPPSILKKLPTDVILVKGAEPSSSDHVTPLPEEGSVSKTGVYQNRYFGLTWPIPNDWMESYKGPPPSDHGTYVLVNILPSPSFKGPAKGTILFTAQDMFFTLRPADNAKELVADRKEHLEPYYDVERPPSEVTIAGRTFARFDYTSKAAGLHWIVLATEIRCHAVQFVLTSRDAAMLETLVKDMDRMTLPAEAGATAGTGGGDAPLCVANYARAETIVERVEPQFKERRFNEIPVRLTIDKKGRVSHVHVVSAFPEQAKAITDALMQWKFKPYMHDGQPVAVETGIMFGNMTHRAPAASPAAVTASKPSD
jgi:hypothetical protein